MIENGDKELMKKNLMHFLYNFLCLERINPAVPVTGKCGNKLVFGIPSHSLNKTLMF
jgi:hypothetical protein